MQPAKLKPPPPVAPHRRCRTPMPRRPIAYCTPVAPSSQNMLHGHTEQARLQCPGLRCPHPMPSPLGSKDLSIYYIASDNIAVCKPPCSAPLQILHLPAKATMHIVHTDGSGPCYTPHSFQLTCNSPPQIPHSRADTASLRPVPMVATILSPATSAQSRPRTPNCRACRRGLGLAYGELPQNAELLCKAGQR